MMRRFNIDRLKNLLSVGIFAGSNAIWIGAAVMAAQDKEPKELPDPNLIYIPSCGYFKI